MTAKSVLADLDRLLESVSPGLALCPPLSRAMVARIAAELRSDKAEIERLCNQLTANGLQSEGPMM